MKEGTRLLGDIHISKASLVRTMTSVSGAIWNSCSIGRRSSGLPGWLEIEGRRWVDSEWRESQREASESVCKLLSDPWLTKEIGSKETHVKAVHEH